MGKLHNALTNWRARFHALRPQRQAGTSTHSSPPLPWRAQLFILLTTMVGVAVVATAAFQWHPNDWARFVCYLVVALFASGLKVVLPGIDGTMSVNFLFILIGILELSFPETLVIGCMSALLQAVWNTKRPELFKVTFNVLGMMAPAIALSYWTYAHSGPWVHHRVPLMVVAAACVYFLSNTLPIALVISLTENQPFRRIWSDCYFWSFPYYLLGAAIAGLVSAVNHIVGWATSLLVLPVVYWIYRSYRLYLSRLEAEKRNVEAEKRHVEEEKRHVEEMAGLHVRTIEALALAIEAKDDSTHDHLQRVRIYALELAKGMALGNSELDALRAAALLHDIGKLAVPDPILNKPGRLTPEEFEKIKIHSLVGAKILEQVNFPYPVVPIVRSHHENWDGSGYPDGLRGEEIPLGARILTAVDFLDALASDRQYRRALPLDEAMEQVCAQAGKKFDPRVVAMLKLRYREMEEIAQAQLGSAEEPGLFKELKVERGTQPTAGFESATSAQQLGMESSFLDSIAAARQEAQMLFELSHELGNSLSLDETLSVLSVRLNKLIPHNTITIYICRGDKLIPQYVSGDDFRLLSSLEIPLGQGLSGWVAQNRKPIINGSPAVETLYLGDSSRITSLRSALAVPLDGLAGVVGVLALYSSAAENAFTKDHLRILQAISSKLGLSIENALKYQQAESSATTDYMTGLPNARSLFLHLESELARSKRTGTTLAVMVCDLNGFKQVNDRFGHLEGNRVLKVFADSIKQICRQYDYVARMGGDEFVIVAPELTPEAAHEKAVLLSTLAGKSGIEVCREEILSASVGVAFHPVDGSNAEQLLSEADRKMYAVKHEHHRAVDQSRETTDEQEGAVKISSER
jgi:diguanylate cyclase (GGDEF)-like protein/putative nucleotidyltransferase with HDIG domain